VANFICSAATLSECVNLERFRSVKSSGLEEKLFSTTRALVAPSLRTGREEVAMETAPLPSQRVPRMQ
jgi:hypothetical protein